MKTFLIAEVNISDLKDLDLPNRNSILESAKAAAWAVADFGSMIVNVHDIISGEASDSPFQEILREAREAGAREVIFNP